jgi:hypothetical protein
MKTKILLLITVFLFGVSAISQSHNLVLVFTAVDSATNVQTASEKSWQVSAKALAEVDLLSPITATFPEYRPFKIEIKK